MDVLVNDGPQLIELRPAVAFAFLKVLPLVLLSLVFLLLALRYWPWLILLSLSCVGLAFYRFLYIRCIRYLITGEIIRVSRGILFKRIDQVELYRLKDYIVYRPLRLQLFGLMDLQLKGTDPENPVIWLRGIPISDLVDQIRDRVQAARGHNQIVEIN